MPLEPIFEDINLTQRKGNVKERIKVECKTDLPSASISKILNVTTRTAISRVETTDKEVLYEGKAIFFICYQNEEGQIAKCECGTEFKGEIKTQEGYNCRAMVFSSVEKTEADISGVRLVVNGYICLDAHLTECKKINVLTGGEELITDGKEIEYVKGYGLRESTFTLEEEFEIDCKVQDVLSQRAEATVTAVQCGVGCIIVDGEVLLSAILLQNRDKNDIIRENKILPFRAEIECEDAMPSMSATAYVREKSFKTDISVDEESSKSQVTASIILALSGEAFSNELLTVVSDAFSTKEDLELEKEKHCFQRPCDIRSDAKEITVSASTDSLPVGTTLVANIGEKAEVLEVLCQEDGLEVKGILTLTAFFKDSENKIFARKLESPFETIISCICEKDCEYNVQVCAHKAKARLISETEIELTAKLFFTAYPYEKCSLDLVKGVKSLGEKPKNTHAISIYIPCEGEELWSLAKRLNVCPETLVNTNQDLQFPLSGKERIVVYRQK